MFLKRGETFAINNDYESIGFNAMYGKAEKYIYYLAHGGVVGIMNLVYLANIEDKPELTPETYKKNFKGTRSYQAEILSSLSVGEVNTRFRVYR